MPTKVKSPDSLLKRTDDRSGSGLIVTPNPSFSCVGSIFQQKSEHDNVQADDGLVGYNKVGKNITSGGVTVDTVSIDPNPAYSVGQDVKLPIL